MHALIWQTMHSACASALGYCMIRHNCVKEYLSTHSTMQKQNVLMGNQTWSLSHTPGKTAMTVMPSKSTLKCKNTTHMQELTGDVPIAAIFNQDWCCQTMFMSKFMNLLWKLHLYMELCLEFVENFVQGAVGICSQTRLLGNCRLLWLTGYHFHHSCPSVVGSQYVEIFYYAMD